MTLPSGENLPNLEQEHEEPLSFDMLCGDVLNRVRRALVSDFVDIYETHRPSWPDRLQYELSKRLFMHLPLDDPNYVANGRPRFQLLLEANAHGYSAENAALGIPEDKFNPQDNVNLRLFDNRTRISTHWHFLFFQERVLFSHTFSKFAPGGGDRFHPTYTIGSEEVGPEEDPLPPVDELKVVRKTLQTGGLDKDTIEEMKNIASVDKNFRNVTENGAISGSTPYFKKLCDIALGTSDFKVQMAKYQKQYPPRRW